MKLRKALKAVIVVACLSFSQAGYSQEMIQPGDPEITCRTEFVGMKYYEVGVGPVTVGVWVPEYRQVCVPG